MHALHTDSKRHHLYFLDQTNLKPYFLKCLTFFCISITTQNRIPSERVRAELFKYSLLCYLQLLLDFYVPFEKYHLKIILSIVNILSIVLYFLFFLLLVQSPRSQSLLIMVWCSSKTEHRLRLPLDSGPI